MTPNALYRLKIALLFIVVIIVGLPMFTMTAWLPVLQQWEGIGIGLGAGLWILRGRATVPYRIGVLWLVVMLIIAYGAKTALTESEVGIAWAITMGLMGGHLWQVSGLSTLRSSAPTTPQAIPARADDIASPVSQNAERQSPDFR